MKREIPLILDIAQNDLDRKALAFIASSATLGRPLWRPQTCREIGCKSFAARSTRP